VIRLPANMEVRVPAHLVSPLQVGIAWTEHRESVVFGLASHLATPGRTVLLVRELMPLPSEAYIAEPGHGAAWSGAATLPVLNEALARHCGIVVFHSHPRGGPVSLSNDDRDNGRRLLAAFQNIIPDRPHGSVVLGHDHSAGIFLLPGQDDYSAGGRVRLLGKGIRDLPSDNTRPVYTPEAAFDRQALLTGRDGEARIRSARIAVVGLSGGGSQVVQQLAHMGVGEIIGIDPAKAKPSHRARLIGITASDAKRASLKTDIMARLVRRINRAVRFTGIPHAIPEQPAIDALKEADIAVGCLDTYHARADLQDLCVRFLIPYVDVGLLIRPVEGGSGVTIGGNVITAIPGLFCLWCVGFLSEERLAAETGGRPRSYFEGADGQAQVVSMNGLLASKAVTEVLQLITGFAPVTEELAIKKYDGLGGTLAEWIVQPDRECAVCRHALGAGELIWTTA